MVAVCATLLWGQVPGQVRASWYGEAHAGRLMANGRRFDPERLTCASWDYPFGTMLRVEGPDGSVVVEVTDRGPAKWTGRKVDLSRAAFGRVADLKCGVVWVRVSRLKCQD